MASLLLIICSGWRGHFTLKACVYYEFQGLLNRNLPQGQHFFLNKVFYNYTVFILLPTHVPFFYFYIIKLHHCSVCNVLTHVFKSQCTIEIKYIALFYISKRQEYRSRRLQNFIHSSVGVRPKYDITAINNEINKSLPQGVPCMALDIWGPSRPLRARWIKQVQKMHRRTCTNCAKKDFKCINAPYRAIKLFFPFRPKHPKCMNKSIK